MTSPLMQKLATGVTPPSPLASSPKHNNQSDPDYLPTIDRNLLVAWNNKFHMSCGWLNKKGGSSGMGGMFGNRGNWQKRFFVLSHKVQENENYLFKYYSRPDDMEQGRPPKGELPLDGAQVLENSSKKDKHKKSTDFAFQIKVMGRKNVFEVTAESANVKDMWMQTLEYAITVASRRGMIMRQRMGSREEEKTDYIVEEDEIPEAPTQRHASQATSAPQIRLEIDITSIPPGSTDRSRFIQSFQDDVSRALSSNGEVACKITEIKPASGMDWLTVVAFEVQSTFTENQTGILNTLAAMVSDPNSDLYMGLVTCRTDPSYEAILGAGEDGSRINVPPTKRAIATPVPRVRTVLEKYMHLDLPPGTHDASKFHVYIRRSANQPPKTLWVPSPRTLPRKSCVLWPYEVKDCLGISGTVADIWMTPLSLIPSNVKSSSHATPLHFEPSAKHGNMPIIDTASMRQGMTYDVEFNDTSGDATADLSEEQQNEIAANFDKYDNNGDGHIDREEVLAAAKDRSDASKSAIDAQFESAIENAGSQQEVNKLIDQKKEHYQKVDEAETALLTMFAKADIDGDGLIEFGEFALAEAWWMKSVLNPTKVSLF